MNFQSSKNLGFVEHQVHITIFSCNEVSWLSLGIITNASEIDETIINSCVTIFIYLYHRTERFFFKKIWHLFQSITENIGCKDSNFIRTIY